MGMIVSAYGKLAPITNPALLEYGALIDGKRNWKPITRYEVFGKDVFEFTERNWPGRTEGVKPDIKYTFKARHSFSAGNTQERWLGVLAEFALGMSREEVRKRRIQGPFTELIDFGTSWGILGPKVAAKLATDFAEHQVSAEFQDGDDSWLYMYNEWHQCIEIAGDNGA